MKNNVISKTYVEPAKAAHGSPCAAPASFAGARLCRGLAAPSRDHGGARGRTL
jgi:hypothetical protein